MKVLAACPTPTLQISLNTARRSVFEVANILILLRKDGRIDSNRVNPLLKELEEESRMILAFRRTLKS